MRFILLFLLSITVVFSSCADSKINTPDTVTSNLVFGDINNIGTTIKIPISTASNWTVTSNALWCQHDKKEGSGDYQLTVKIGANLAKSERSAILTIKSEEEIKTVSFKQKGAPTVADNYHYKIPIIFHVLYKSKADHTQYVDRGRLCEIIETVNNMYRESGVNMNLEFTLATHTPNGDILEEQGIERIMWNDEYPIDCEEFMQNNERKYVNLLWDPNQYINVMVYNFVPVSGSIILGISHLPYTARSYRLDGTSYSPQPQLTTANLSYAHCVSINSSYIYNQSSETQYNTADINVTLAHELGHYLGLHHTFYENNNDTNGCKDTDYCQDTPSYNRYLYDTFFSFSQPFSALVKRHDCNGQEFTSHNIMDYIVSLSDQFSTDQRKRVRHVLTYSPLIPGPKIGSTKSFTSSDELLDLPFQVIK